MSSQPWLDTFAHLRMKTAQLKLCCPHLKCARLTTNLAHFEHQRQILPLEWRACATSQTVFFLLPPWFAMYVLCYKHSNIVQRNSQSSFLALRGPRQNSANSCHILLVIIGKMKKMLHHLHTVVVADKPGNSRSAQLVCTVQKAHFFIWPSTSWQWKTTHLLRVFPTGEFACCPTECTMQIHCSNMKSIFMFTCAINVLACNEAVFN